jgi:magnesium-transporting ATPase (P-type)
MTCFLETLQSGISHVAGSTKDIKWHEVHVGMVLEVRDNEDIPADLLCLHCPHPDNICFIKTVNLDGKSFDFLFHEQV